MEKYTFNKLNLLKFSTFFTSSCKTQNLCEVIDHSKNPIFTPQNPIFLQTTFLENIQDNEVKQELEKYPFGNFLLKPQKTSEENYINAPPASPVSPLFRKQGNKNKKLKNKEKIKYFKNNNYGFKNGFSSSNETDDKGDWFSSDDEREYFETQTMFSLKSLSFSSESDNNVIIQTRKKTHVNSRNRKKTKSLSFLSDSEKSSNQSRIQKKTKSTSLSLDSGNLDRQAQTHTQTSLSFSSESDNNVIIQTREKTHVKSQTRKKTKSLSLSDSGKSSNHSQTRKKTKSTSLSFDSGNLNRQSQAQTQTQTREKTKLRRRKSSSRVREMGVVSLEGKVKDTFAIVKSSSDPYDDFRKSMVEMIIEKQIFSAKELEQLLDCFIHLNSCHHHRVIVEVFIEICDALFSNCS